MIQSIKYSPSTRHYLSSSPKCQKLSKQEAFSTQVWLCHVVCSDFHDPPIKYTYNFYKFTIIKLHIIIFFFFLAFSFFAELILFSSLSKSDLCLTNQYLFYEVYRLEKLLLENYRKNNYFLSFFTLYSQFSLMPLCYIELYLIHEGDQMSCHL